MYRKLPFPSAKGAIHPSLGQRPRNIGLKQVRAESPFHPPRKIAELDRAFSPLSRRTAFPGALPPAGMNAGLWPSCGGNRRFRETL